MITIELSESTVDRLDNIIEAYESDTGRESSYDKMIAALLGTATY